MVLEKTGPGLPTDRLWSCRSLANICEEIGCGLRGHQQITTADSCSHPLSPPSPPPGHQLVPQTSSPPARAPTDNAQQSP